MPKALHTLQLTWEQFDVLEEAADTMSLGHHYVGTLEEAIYYLAQKYIDEYGPEFEANWGEEQRPETATDQSPHLWGIEG